MKKRIFGALTCAFLLKIFLSGPAYATQARVQALGGTAKVQTLDGTATKILPGAFHSIEDDRDIFLFPSQANTHRNTAFVDMYSLGDANDGSSNPQTNGQEPSAGGIFGFNNGLSLGMFVNRDDSGIRASDFSAFFTATPTAAPTTTPTPLENPLDLFASFKRGIFTAGVSVHLANGQDDTEATSDGTTVLTTSGTPAAPVPGTISNSSTEKESDLKKVGIGATIDLGPGADSYVDVSLHFTSFEATNKQTTHDVTYPTTPATTAQFSTVDRVIRQKAESDGIFSVMARAFLPIGGSTLRFVPSAYASGQKTKFNTSDTATTTSTTSGITTPVFPDTTKNNPSPPNELTLEEARYGLGLGLNRTTSNNMVAVNLNLENWSMKSRRDVNTGASGVDNSDLKTGGIPLSLNAAFESKMGKPWLIGRVGIRKTIFGKLRSDTRTTATTTIPAGNTAAAPAFNTSTPGTSTSEINTDDSDSDFLSIGLGIVKGNFSLDAVVVESNFFSGTYLLSGNKANLFAAISGKLKF